MLKVKARPIEEVKRVTQLSSDVSERNEALDVSLGRFIPVFFLLS